MNRAFQQRFTYLLKNINGLLYIQDIRNIPKSEIQYNLVKYFNLQYKETEMVSMKIDMDDLQQNRIVISVEYSTKKPFVQLKGIPFELSRMIYSYIPHNKIQLKFAISFPENYPFCPPKWSLVEDHSNISDISNLIVTTTQYYQEIVDTHNNQYKHSPDLDIDGSEPYPFTETCPHKKSMYSDSYNWSPAHYIEKDILNFILRINHFEYIVQDVFEPTLLTIPSSNDTIQLMKTQTKIYQPWKFVLQ
jgi:ubiquitin-protein ligase